MTIFLFEIYRWNLNIEIERVRIVEFTPFFYSSKNSTFYKTFALFQDQVEFDMNIKIQ